MLVRMLPNRAQQGSHSGRLEPMTFVPSVVAPTMHHPSTLPMTHPVV